MRRNRLLRRGGVAVILAAIAIVYAAGGWRTTALRSTGLTPAQSVALRFPESWNDTSVMGEADGLPSAAGMDSTSATRATQLALLSPAPMMPEGMALVPAQAAPPPRLAQPAPMPQPALPATAVQATAADARHLALREARQTQLPAAAAQANPAREAAVAGRHRANRPGYLLNDAQIASIKQRLNLTPEQEQMWPAVEAALRNIAYAKGREERRRGTSAETQTASIDPDSAEVQGLKSAAVPLIMSFSDEQKEEVRNIAHVMGLDQLAEQF